MEGGGESAKKHADAYGGEGVAQNFDELSVSQVQKGTHAYTYIS